MLNDEPLGRRPKGKAMLNRRQTECNQVYLELPRCEGGKDCVAGLIVNCELSIINYQLSIIKLPPRRIQHRGEQFTSSPHSRYA